MPMSMNYFSAFDGIGAAHVSLLPLGYQCIGVSEIARNCNKLIETKYGFKNYGDFRQWRDFKLQEFSLVIGGTQCQPFSILGSKRGFDDERGKLTKDFIDFICHHQPQWFVWENVPGIFSINGGEPFRYLLSRFTECGFGVAWRVLDAQFFGVPQRRRRVFVVGCFGNPIRAGKVLFDGAGVSVHPRSAICKKTNHQRTDAVNSQGGGVSGTLTTNTGHIGGDRIELLVVSGGRVRRLTPLECERLMGLPDFYTEGFTDNQRYKIIGNSMAIPVIRWIGKKILEVHEETKI